MAPAMREELWNEESGCGLSFRWWPVSYFNFRFLFVAVEEVLEKALDCLLLASRLHEWQ
jgi:hypothetical protein